MASRPPNEISRKALLVAPSYKGLPPENQLPGTAYDLQVMEKVTLADKFRFDVTTVVRENATKEKILESLGNLSSTAEPGSVVLFYFSGHGAYLPRIKDEGLVPADATSEKLKDAPEDICITGKDLEEDWKKFAKKDVKVTVIFDCCHSGQLYRGDIDLENSGRPRQVFFKNYLDTKSRSPSSDKSEETGKEVIFGGWTPDKIHAFFYFAACTRNQVAVELKESGGRLTMAIESVFNNREGNFQKVSIKAFYRLIVREFIKEGWYETQRPQLEGERLDTEMFGIDEVPSPRSGITVNNVNGDVVFLDQGFLQNMLPGVYDVFETTVIVTDVEDGKNSSYWLGTIEVSEERIKRAKSSGLIKETRNTHEDYQISPGCLAFLKTPGSIKNNAWVNITSDDPSAREAGNLLISHINGTKIINATDSKSEIPGDHKDLITIGIERYETSGQKEFWVARQGDADSVIVPPISLGREKIMADNLDRYLRYQLALASAKPPSLADELLENVRIKVVKLKNVEPFNANSRSIDDRIKEGLKGEDLYKDDASQCPVLKAHSLIDPNSNTPKDKTGDAFVFQVTRNHTDKEKKDVVHICVLLYQFDGAIKQIDAPKKGKTTELGGEGTVQNIFRVFIPSNSLRKMAQPDPTLPEPKSGVDTIVVYATSQPADFGPLLQTALETDSNIIPRGLGEEVKTLSDLEKFLLPIRERCVEDHPEGFKWVVEKRKFEVEKNNKDAENTATN